MNNLQHEEQIFSLIERYSGLTINSAHRNYMRSYIKNRLAKLHINENNFYAYIQANDKERRSLIDEAAINETYFFREEKQFDFLNDVFFPKYNSGKIVIWSAACSTGEEPISLYALAKAHKKDATIFATDIDTAALDILQKGKYTKNSFRADGAKYHKLLDVLGTRLENQYQISPEINLQIKKYNYNLVSEAAPPLVKESVNLLFLRNVFIYFSEEVRKKVIRKMADYLAPGGILFLSINDIASVECDDDVPLIKENVGAVYYFRKVDMAMKAQMQAAKTESMKKLAFSAPHQNTKRIVINGKVVVRKTASALDRKNSVIGSRSVGEFDGKNGVSVYRNTANNGAPTGMRAGDIGRQNTISMYRNKVNGLSTAAAPRNILASSSAAVPESVAATTSVPNVRTVGGGSVAGNSPASYDTQIQQLAKNVFVDLGNKKTEDAKEKISAYGFRPENFEYQAYLNGLVAQHENNDTRAEFYFKKANLYEPKFWPSYFKLGQIYEKSGNAKDRKKAFTTCALLLETYVKNQEICYNFLMEHFSPSYFLDICRKYAIA